METESWHSSFNPKKFLSRVNLDKLIEHNEAYNENKVVQGNTPCILCSSKQGPGILLNDKSYLCKSCFSEVSTITYPQKYEEDRRNYLKAKESRRIALEELTKQCAYTKEGTSVTIFAFVSIVLLFIHIGLLVVPAILFVVSSFIEKEQERKLQIWNKQKTEWENVNPEPNPPELKHFHDPQAHLTAKDHTILKIFNNWPGLPPFWKYLREVVLSRDGDHCQVSGCPSRVTLHVHHKSPVSKGGEHVPDNLVSLCDFHHALEPDEGHERIWGSIKTRYFTIVRKHTRHNRAGSGYHNVRAHVRRLELVKKNELNEIKRFYSLSCPSCGSGSISILVKDKVNVVCGSCSKKWSGPKELTEETGPRLAEFLTIKRNQGIWKAKWDMLSSRTSNVFSALSSSKKSKTKSKKPKTLKNIREEDKPLCPKCGSPMKIIAPKKGQRWKKFWGCTKYWSEGCRGSIKA
ncbi:MAG: HNH endonuclease signature motif containing protein [Candidatus Electryonea clarkiae]|nr:HNH endonuclease signature motif containing protein [Candidatus Electryonea clarkiae]MDP8288563.1 HNH endonuclease signature motif containing protein [Candidatus Electryonea clarkiae]